jgi:hypothetical protein
LLVNFCIAKKFLRFAFTKVTKKFSQATIFHSFLTINFSYQSKKQKKEQKPDWISAQTSLKD